METSSKERDGGGEGKSLAYELGSVRGEKFCVIINRIGGGGGWGEGWAILYVGYIGVIYGYQAFSFSLSSQKNKILDQA